MTYPIHIPYELVDHWRDLYQSEGHMPEWILRHVASEAARWGSNQELEACCEWLDFYSSAADADDLRVARSRRAFSAHWRSSMTLEPLTNLMRSDG